MPSGRRITFAQVTLRHRDEDGILLGDLATFDIEVPVEGRFVIVGDSVTITVVLDVIASGFTAQSPQGLTVREILVGDPPSVPRDREPLSGRRIRLVGDE